MDLFLFLYLERLPPTGHFPEDGRLFMTGFASSTLGDTDLRELVATIDRRMLVQVAVKDGYTIFRHVGCLTGREKGAVTLFNKAVMESPGKAAVIDMTDTFLIDSFGLGNLLILNGAMATHHKVLAIMINGESTVLKRLRSTRITDVVPVYPSLTQCALALARL